MKKHILWAISWAVVIYKIEYSTSLKNNAIVYICYVMIQLYFVLHNLAVYYGFLELLVQVFIILL